MDDQYTFENKTYRDTYRHTTSHILAQAMKRLYPEVKLAIGPAIEDGFYYDFDSPQPFTPEVLEKLEAEMRKICKEKLRLERFDLEYVGADGEKHRPVMIHRVCFGSIERFIGILTEHYAGAFPLWLAPVQVKVMPITDRTNNYAKHVADRLEKAGLRVETDLRNEKIGYKIREAQSQKIPYMLVLGDKEAENDTISVRTLSGEQSVEGLSDFIARLQADVKSRKS